uniref:Reverse transcriptase domain-containing protein n=1 Tax=Oreochromis niloticus TaxID=8128 RepID=A0A669B572_ORENI
MDKTQRESIALSLDAEKAFDSVRWDYLFWAMERFGFGDPFIQLIKNLYYLPSARIKINGSLTGVVDLQRGCRQGCPLSPALFALFIEPLAQAIREDEQIKGIWIRNTEYKIGLYADDILLTLTDPERSLPKLWLKMQMFGELSGYKINIQKTQSITYNYVPTTKIKSMSKFNWNNKIIKYLGIKIPKTLTEIYELNYSPITRELKENIQRWSLLPLDLYNRIDLIKMNILPPLLFLFQSIPVHIPVKQFALWNRMISGFIWKGRKPRVRYITLQLPRERGGLSLPNLENYFKAAQLRYLIYWCDPSYEAKWKYLDVTQLKVPLQTILGDKKLYLEQKNNLNEWTKTPLKIWFDECESLKSGASIKQLRWVTHDKEFIPAQTDRRYTTWLIRGIGPFCSLSGKGLHRFEKLRDTYGLENQDFFRYLQVRSYFNSNIRTTEENSEGLVPLIKEAYEGQIKNKLIAKLYRNLQSLKDQSTDYIKIKWEMEAKINISEDSWLNICRTQMESISSGYWREFIWKNFIRFFITPKIKYKQKGQPTDGYCWRNCGENMADHFHIFWKCPIIQPYWNEMVESIYLVTGFKLNLDFCTVYLGDIPSTVPLKDKYLINILLGAGKKALTRKWLEKEPPTKKDWIGIMEEIYRMEKLTSLLNLKMDQFYKNWRKWERFVEEGNS